MPNVVRLRRAEAPAEAWQAVVLAVADELRRAAPADAGQFRDRLRSLVEYDVADRLDGDAGPAARNALLLRLIDRLGA